MTPRFAAAAALAALMTAPAVADRPVALDDGAIDAIDARGRFDVRVLPGDTLEVRLVGDEADYDEVIVDVRRGELRIRQRARGILRSRSALDVTVEISAPALERLEFGEGVDAVANGLTFGDVRLEVSTGADARVSGTCEAARIDVSTGASLNARELTCQSVDIGASTGADADVYAEQRIDASASTGADIDVYGPAPQTEFSSSLGGSVGRR